MDKESRTRGNAMMTVAQDIALFDPIDYMATHQHEQLIACFDRETGLRALIAIHDTTLGPALGGTRLKAYPATADAMEDVLRLSEAMTYKAAMAGLALGGGKAVILADGAERDPAVRAARLQAFGRCIERLGGRFITAEDVGTAPADMAEIRSETRHVVGIPAAIGGGGDPAPTTAYGVLQGMRALAEDVLQRESLAGVGVAIQGLGHVGMNLAEMLMREDAMVIGADIQPELEVEAKARLGISIGHYQTIHQEACDIFAPCALGAVLNDTTIPQLNCRVVAGSANNQLLDEQRHGDMLDRRGIIYAVDYVINAGGLIHAAQEVASRGKWSARHEERAQAKTSEIYHTIRRLVAEAQADHIPTYQAAKRIALGILSARRSQP
jgi:leucine dehydrogenase